MAYDTTVPTGDELEAIAVARDALADWKAAQPDNYFVADRNLQRLLEFYWGEERYKALVPRLYRFGGVAATVLDELVRVSNEEANLPRLERYNGIGQRIEEVAYHPTYHEAGRLIYGSGVMEVYEEPGSNLLSLALFYLSSLNGEAGHNCPVAMTAGVVKALQAEGAPELQARYLPGLLDPEYDSNLSGGQFLTEVQGGSDVGANAVVARPLDPETAGTWLINGEKWFTSNVTADLILATARVPEQGGGTRGLGLFLIPRHLEDGSLNRFYIRRLKDKLGTRSLATAEVEFRDALAYQVGDLENGFRNMMVYVINTSRIFNAVGCAAIARRAYFVAWGYARYRRAFGQPIIHFPLVQDILTKMRSDAAAIFSGTMRIVQTLDEIETGKKDDAATGAFLRMALNLNKYRASLISHEVAQQGIEILGGNGTIEDFSVLPRLLRDNVVFENWEGSHNVLLAQVQRDMQRYQIHEPFFELVEEMLSGLPFKRLQREGLAQLAEMREQLDALLQMEPLSASLPFRPLMDRLTDLYYVACMGVEAAWEVFKKEDRSKQRLAEFFFDRRVMKREAIDMANYADQVSRLCADIRPSRVEKDADRAEEQL